MAQADPMIALQQNVSHLGSIAIAAPGPGESRGFIDHERRLELMPRHVFALRRLSVMEIVTEF